MKTNKLQPSSSFYHPENPSQNIQRYQSYQLHQYKHLPKKPIIFSISSHQKNKSTELHRYITKEQKGVFSLEKMGMDKVREQKQFLESAKKPSFNIKKMFDKNFKKKREAKEVISDNIMSRTELVATEIKNTNYNLRDFWNKYLQSQPLNTKGTRDLDAFNRNIGVIVNRNIHNFSEGFSKTSRDHSDLMNNPEKDKDERMDRLLDSKDRTTFYVNNFIKTRYKKRSNPSTSNSPRLNRQPPELEIIPKRPTPKRVEIVQREEPFQKNWVKPWQKVHDTEQDNFIS